jgi:hypothetical protein
LPRRFGSPVVALRLSFKLVILKPRNPLSALYIVEELYLTVITGRLPSCTLVHPVGAVVTFSREKH